MTEQAKAASATKINPTQVLQRVIMPRDEDPLDVRPLYLDEPTNVHSHVSGRRAVTVQTSAKVSFASYFNAFPASYWKRWTIVEEVVLRMRVRGAGRIDVYRSKPNGDIIHLDGQVIRSPKAWFDVALTVSLKPFEDGGWIWFDVFTDDTTMEIDDAAWTTEQPLPAADRRHRHDDDAPGRRGHRAARPR